MAAVLENAESADVDWEAYRSSISNQVVSLNPIEVPLVLIGSFIDVRVFFGLTLKVVNPTLNSGYLPSGW